MPYAAPTPCSYPGCKELTSSKVRRCPEHEKLIRKNEDKRRGSPASRGYDHNWRKLRLVILQDEPLCRLCKQVQRITAAQVVDHIDGNTRNNERDNLRPLCKKCHDTRTAKDQGWGKKKHESNRL